MRRGSSPISKIRAHTVSIFTCAPRTPHGPRKASARPARHRHITCTCSRMQQERQRERQRSGQRPATSRGRARGRRIAIHNTCSGRGRRGRPRASPDRPPPRCDRCTRVVNRHQTSLLEPSSRRNLHRVTAEAYCERRRARSDQRQIQALLSMRACLRIALIRPGASASGQSLSARLDTARTGKLTRTTIAGAGMGTPDAIASRSADGGATSPAAPSPPHRRHRAHRLRCRRTGGLRTGGGQHHTAQCVAACPPPQGGSQGGGGLVPSTRRQLR